jgi:hypothetical protein
MGTKYVRCIKEVGVCERSGGGVRRKEGRRGGGGGKVFSFVRTCER